MDDTGAQARRKCRSRWWILWLGRVLGVLAFSVLRIRRAVALENIQNALGITQREAVELASKVYTHLCTGLLEFLQLGALTPSQARGILGREGELKMRAILDQGRGMIVLSAHLGHWDLLACAAALCGIKVNVVTRKIKNTWINRFWMKTRSACGVQLIAAEGGGMKVVKALRRNEVVAMVLDQHEPGGLVVPFFGRPAATGDSLARLARMTRAPVVPIFLLRKQAGFQLEVQDPIEFVSSTNKSKDFNRQTAQYTEIIEDAIRRTPAQWLWLHRRWKVPLN